MAARPRAKRVGAAFVAAAASRAAHALLVPVILIASLAVARPARAQRPQAWLPPSADSLQHWASEAKVRFQEAQGDTIGGPNYRAYDLVGQMGRRLLRAYGRTGVIPARGITATLDSLGLSAEMVVDPTFSDFMLLMVRNPYKRSAYALGFIYWKHGDDLRMQGAQFYGGLKPNMRVWWTGFAGQPYSLGVLDHGYGSPPAINMTLFRLSPDGTFWNLVQYRDNGPDLSGGGEASWVDINSDNRPELVAWVHAKNDTLFAECVDCSPIIHELTYVESAAGFHLYDLRVLPSPYSTFTLFIRLLADGNRAAAARLLKDPARLEEAVAGNWGSRHRARAWVLEYGEETPWPRWLEFLHHGTKGDTRYIVRFELLDGRWIISDWVVPHRVDRGAAADSTKRDSTASRAKAGAKTARPAKPPARGGHR
ncbi:MAG: hypothetical protein HY076_09260 [Candidatus Eisenbacteria bacterium]|uniref:Uncharacterized protein n=1 Tax=Eiseniibacteriota bacterium TaxID=2212470 RepID=A0A9D6L827_UNCEI|nr:hypothetical protein [Candidatus Eisenbacteria bacterium]MBI3540446.1 hypothetical protein [Candidatus Eisenbacteria bacterium]